MNFYYDVYNLDVSIYGKEWKPVEYLSDSERREKVKQHILKKRLNTKNRRKKVYGIINRISNNQRI